MTSIEGEVIGKNKIGRRRKTWVDNIAEWSREVAIARNNARSYKIVLT